MAAGHDLNSLNSSSVTPFTRDKTSVQAWSEEERSRISGLSNENNLDPSYHGARVSIISKKDGGAMDLGGHQDGKTQVLRWPRSRRNRNQWIRLEKVDPKQATSPWYLRCDREDQDTSWLKSRYDMYVADTTGTEGIYAALVPGNSDLSKWLISWDSEGHYRIKNVRTGWYLSNLTETNLPPEKPEGCYMGTHSRDETDLQLWRIERLTTPLLDDDDTQHLGQTYHKTWAAIVEISGSRSLDVGGSDNRIYLRQTDTLNEAQIMRLEKVQENNGKSPWRIRATFVKDGYGVASKDQKRVIRVAPKDDAPEQQWYIRQTPAGAFRIQNVQTKYYLECLPENNENNLKLEVSDKGSGSEQLFTVIKLPPK